MRAIATTGVLIAAVAMLAPASAAADVVTTMTNELQAAGVPNVSVSVPTPAPATSADLAAYEEDLTAATPSITPENLISPDPTSPLPVATVRFGSSLQTALPGLIAPDGGFAPTREAAESAIWRAEIMSAMKHVLADGASLAGVALQPIGEPRPDMWLTPPDPGSMPPARLAGTMPLAEIEAKVRHRLAQWAPVAAVRASELGTERRVRIEIATAPEQFILGAGHGLASYLLDQQLKLNESDAGIGGVSVKFTEIASRAPLFVYAGDATFGQNFHWSSPLVSAWVGRVPAEPTAESVRKLVPESSGNAEIDAVLDVASGAADDAEVSVHQVSSEAEELVERETAPTLDAAEAALDATIHEQGGDDLYTCAFEATADIFSETHPGAAMRSGWAFTLQQEERGSFSGAGPATCFQRDNNVGQPSDKPASREDNSGTFEATLQIYGRWEHPSFSPGCALEMTLRGEPYGSWWYLEPKTGSGQPGGAGEEGEWIHAESFGGQVTAGLGEVALFGFDSPESSNQVELGSARFEMEVRGKSAYEPLTYDAEEFSPTNCLEVGTFDELRLRGFFTLRQHQW